MEIKKAEPKKASNPPSAPAYGSNSRARSFNDGFGGYGSSYGGFDGGFGGSDDPILPAPSEMLPEEGFALREWRR